MTLLVVVSVQVMGISGSFILGFPLYVRWKVQQRMQLYRWEPYEVEASGRSQKGRWVRKQEGCASPTEKSVFELGDKVRRMQVLVNQLSWAERHLDKDQLARWLPEIIHQKLFTQSHQTHRVVAVLNAMENARAQAVAQWEHGMTSYLSRTQDQKGLDSLWMCSRDGWIQWKVFNTFAEKSFMFMFAKGVVGNIVFPDQCSSRLTDNESGSESVLENDSCSKLSVTHSIRQLARCILRGCYVRAVCPSVHKRQGGSGRMLVQGCQLVHDGSSDDC